MALQVQRPAQVAESFGAESNAALVSASKALARAEWTFPRPLPF